MTQGSAPTWLGLAALGVLVAFGCAARGPRASTDSVRAVLDSEAAQTAREVGPAHREARPGATVVTTSQELARVLGDPLGPKEVELAKGVYRGDFVIRRPLAVRGMEGAILEGTGTGTVVTIEGADVILENLVIRSSGRRHTQEDSAIKARGERIAIANVRVEDALFGVSLEACKACSLTRVHVLGFGDDAELRGDGIKLWESNDSVVRQCVVEHSRDVVVWYTKRATLEDLVVIGGRYGTHFMYAHDSVVRRSRLENNIVGVFVMYSMRLRVEDSVLAGARGAAGVGIGFKDSDDVTVRGNWFVANTAGAYLDNTPRSPEHPAHLQDNLFALNDVGLRFHASERGLEVHGNDFHQNATLVDVEGGGDARSVDVSGNYFSDYEGYDLDNDGIGDVAYEVRALSSELVDERPAIGFFAGTAAMGLFDTVARAVPVLSSKKLLVDPAPRIARSTKSPPRTP